MEDFNQFIYCLDLLGTFGFAVYGSKKAIEHSLDILGVLICAFCISCGGGIRDSMLINKVPALFTDVNYFFVIISAVILVYILENYKSIFVKFNFVFQLFDTIGLVTFSLISIRLAHFYNYNFVGIIVFAVVGSCFGGVLKDLMLNKKPELVYKYFYGDVAVLMGVFVSVSPNTLNSIPKMILLMAAGFVVRYFVIRHNLSLIDFEKKWLRTIK
jgi:uncharacterized membrane protein YeiH